MNQRQRTRKLDRRRSHGEIARARKKYITNLASMTKPCVREAGESLGLAFTAKATKKMMIEQITEHLKSKAST